MNNKIAGHILVVDDQSNWRAALVALLSAEGHTIEAATCFEEAHEKISQQVFDLVVLDVRLVDKEIFNVQGLELLQLIKAQTPSPRVIVLTGYPGSIRTGTLEKWKADALILKVPLGSRFDSQGFKERVRNLLRKARSDSKPL
jgi:CheY-like chemotaxis protein